MWHPAMLPTIMAETRTFDTPTRVAKHKDSVAKLEKDAGVYKNQYYEDTLHAETLAPSAARDFDNVLNGLLPIRTDLDYLNHKCQGTLDFLNFVDELVVVHELLQLHRNKLPVTETFCMSVCKAKIAYQRTWVLNSQTRCKYVIDRAAALVNQVR